MLLSQRRAQRRHRAVKAVLVQRNRVHIPLGQNDPALFALFRHVERKEVFPFVEDGRLGRVEVFGRRVVHHAPAEADHGPAHVDDGKHQPVAEPVVHAAVFTPDGKARVQQFLPRIALFRHRVQKRGPLVRAEAQAKARDGGFAQPALYDICARSFSRRLHQLRMEEPRRVLAQRIQPLLFAVLRAVGLVLGHLHPRALGKKAHRVGVAEALDLHDKVDHAAALVAAEAVVDALVGRDGKRCRLLPVERAQAEQVRALAREAHILPHDLVDGISLYQLVEKHSRKGHGAHLLSGRLRGVSASATRWG